MCVCIMSAVSAAARRWYQEFLKTVVLIGGGSELPDQCSGSQTQVLCHSSVYFSYGAISPAIMGHDFGFGFLSQCLGHHNLKEVLKIR